MSVEAKQETIEGLLVKSTPLPPMTTIDLLPELLEFQGAFSSAKEGDQFDEAEFMIAIAKLLGNKRMRALLPQLLASTSVVIPELPTGLMLNSDGNINIAFQGRMRALPGAVALAVKVSFVDFFEGVGNLLEKLQAPSS